MKEDRTEIPGDLREDWEPVPSWLTNEETKK